MRQETIIKDPKECSEQERAAFITLAGNRVPRRGVRVMGLGCVGLVLS